MIPMIILGIETSCDETAVSVIEAGGPMEKPVFKVLGSALQSQIDMHAKYGGVVPNLAKREHLKNLPIVLSGAVSNSGIDLAKIEMIAVTVGPGLEPALWTGINFAKDLGERLGVKVVPTNHMEGHITSVLAKGGVIEFPAISLLVSGGHTELIFLESWKNKIKIGETRDDAVGEAFDKVARMHGLPYPGGPQISKLAEEAREQGLSLETKFPRPMIYSGDYDFSFSGLKTAVLYYLKSLTSPPISYGDNTREAVPPLLDKERGLGGEVIISQKTQLAVAREFEDAVMDTLIFKTKKAIEEYNPKTLVVGGGVVSNTELRKRLEALGRDYTNIKIMLPEKNLSTDNAVMIAIAGYIEHLKGSENKRALEANGNLELQ